MRTEKDSWDITTSVGSTALFVATARALEAQRPEPLAVAPYAEVFCRAVGGQSADVLDNRSIEHPLVTPGFGDPFVSFQGARTRFFDAYFNEAAAAGVQQIVLLAAGLDSRAYRLDWQPGTVVYELDQSQVLEFKRETLAAHGAEQKAERREIAVDLREDWPAALRANGFDPDAPSAWIAEGLLIYLTGEAQAQLFAGIDSLAAAGSRVAVEEGRPMDDDAFKAKVAETKDTTDEREQWWQLIYNEQHAPAADWFSQHGWDASGTRLADYLASVGRSVASADEEAVHLIDSITLVSGVKR